MEVERVPIAIDIFCGLGGWTEGLLAEGWEVYGFDIERHDYGTGVYPAQLILQDALTIHGSQFRNADLIVASPPCQRYSYIAQPWKRAKALGKQVGKGRRGQSAIRCVLQDSSGGVRSGWQIHSDGRGERKRRTAMGRKGQSTLRQLLPVGRYRDARKPLSDTGPNAFWRRSSCSTPDEAESWRNVIQQSGRRSIGRIQCDGVSQSER